MDITYYHQKFVLEMYVGMLEEEVELREEKNPLLWLPLTEDFTDRERFAGEQNIAHIINVAKTYPIPGRKMIEEGRYIGIDGCKNGWIAAVIDYGRLRIERYNTIEEIMKTYPVMDAYLIDMAIGLQEKAEDIRPDPEARKQLGSKGSSIFPIPCRQAVYAQGKDPLEMEAEQKKANKEVLGKSLSKQSIAIIPKIRELDEYLDNHEVFRNVLCESHPELCFARLAGDVLRTRKSEFEGITERMNVLSGYLKSIDIHEFFSLPKVLDCKADDILDAACLAVTACLKEHGLCETIPESPESDAKGLLMQLVIPRASVR